MCVEDGLQAEEVAESLGDCGTKDVDKELGIAFRADAHESVVVLVALAHAHMEFRTGGLGGSRILPGVKLIAVETGTGGHEFSDTTRHKGGADAMVKTIMIKVYEVGAVLSGRNHKAEKIRLKLILSKVKTALFMRLHS